MTKRDIRLVLIIIAVLFLNAFVFAINYPTLFSTDTTESAPPPCHDPEVVYGQIVDSCNLEYGVVKSNQFFSDILRDYGIEGRLNYDVTQYNSEFFNPARIRAGNKFCVIDSDTSDTLVKADKLVYEVDKVDYVVIHFQEDTFFVQEKSKPIITKSTYASGVINYSLYETMVENNINPIVAYRMADIYAWTIDFYRLNKGDKFKLYFEEQFVDGESIGVNRIKNALFNHGDKDIYAFYYEHDSLIMPEYYNEKGESLRRSFLQAPVKFSRISSRYTMRRFHPVQKRWKSHLGTDYAAPSGTPIYATANGKVVHAKYGKYNGRNVKIRHNKTYTTQYLHMSRFAKGIKAGVYVAQGDVIGYVGSTGLATGPHVCYRFWKNGKQVDPYKQDLPAAEPIPQELNTGYLAFADSMKQALDLIEYPKPVSDTIEVDTSIYEVKPS